MDIELQILDVAAAEPTVQYQFVVDADLVHVGGGTGLMDY